jgi:hypothetical protein
MITEIGTQTFLDPFFDQEANWPDEVLRVFGRVPRCRQAHPDRLVAAIQIILSRKADKGARVDPAQIGMG